MHISYQAVFLDNRIYTKTTILYKIFYKVKGKAVPVQSYYMPRGLQEVEAPKFEDNRYVKWDCQPYVPAALTDPLPRKYCWYSYNSYY